VLLDSRRASGASDNPPGVPEDCPDARRNRHGSRRTLLVSSGSALTPGGAASISENPPRSTRLLHEARRDLLVSRGSSQARDRPPGLAEDPLGFRRTRLDSGVAAWTRRGSSWTRRGTS